MNKKRHSKKRNRAYYRHQRNRAIQRKKQILEHNRYDTIDRPLTAKQIGQLAKGKVHCSCIMCRYEQHMNIPRTKDLSKKEAMEHAIKEYYLN